MSENVDVSKRIRNIRKNLGMSMEEFGKLFDPVASKGVVSNWENNYNLPNNERLQRIAKLGDMTVDELLHGSKEEIATSAISDALSEFINEWDEFKKDYISNKERYHEFLTHYYNDFMDINNPYAFQVQNPYEFIKDRVKTHLEREFLKSERTDEEMTFYFKSLISNVQSDIYEYEHDQLTQDAIKSGKINAKFIETIFMKLNDILIYIDNYKDELNQ